MKIFADAALEHIRISGLKNADHRKSAQFGIRSRKMFKSAQMCNTVPQVRVLKNRYIPKTKKMMFPSQTEINGERTPS